MKNRNYSLLLLDVAFYLGCAVIGVLLVSGPITGYYRVQIEKEALNKQCGTSYGFLEVALAGDNLARLCQTKSLEAK